LTISPLSWGTPKDISLLYALVKEQVGFFPNPGAISLTAYGFQLKVLWWR